MKKLACSQTSETSVRLRATPTNIALLDPNGNFLRNVVLTDTSGFTLPGPGPGPGPGTAPEPATLLLVVNALAVLGFARRKKMRPISR